MRIAAMNDTAATVQLPSSSAWSPHLDRGSEIRRIELDQKDGPLAAAICNPALKYDSPTAADKAGGKADGEESSLGVVPWPWIHLPQAAQQNLCTFRKKTWLDQAQLHASGHKESRVCDIEQGTCRLMLIASSCMG